MPDLYPSLLGPAWAHLALAVQRLHAGSAGARGSFRVRRGQRLLARLLATLLGMPPAADNVAISLKIERSARGERWTRAFGDRIISTAQWSRDNLLIEAMGLIQCIFCLCAAEEALVFQQVGAAIGLGRFALPLPRWLAPRVEGRAEPREGGVYVEVRIYAPLAGLLVAYDGSVSPEEGA
jgi:hypothetical protein